MGAHPRDLFFRLVYHSSSPGWAPEGPAAPPRPPPRPRWPHRPLPLPGPHNDVSPSDKLQAYLEHSDVQEVDEVAHIVHQQPQVDIVQRLVGEGPAHGNQPAVPVPGQHHEEQPQDVHQVCGGARGWDCSRTSDGGWLLAGASGEGILSTSLFPDVVLL